MGCHVFIATSLDGFIARPDGGIDWLPAEGAVEAPDHGYDAFLAGIDAIVMGRNTYEKVLTFGAWPFAKPVVVLSGGNVRVEPGLEGQIVPMSGAPAEIVAQCAARGWRELYIDGGVTIQRFLRDGLIERLIITRVPIILGAGLPLFGPLAGDLRMTHVHTQAFSNGLVQGEYRVMHVTP